MSSPAPRHAASAAVIAMVLAFTAPAQTVNGTIVRAVGWSGASSATGQFVAPLLPVGYYDVTGENPGFKKVQVSRVKVDLGQTVQVNLSMSPGELIESVAVSADVASVRLETNTSSVGTLIDPSQMRDLPLPSSDPMNLLVLVNGVSTGGTATSVATYQLSINGGRTLNTEVTLDGASVLENSTGQISALPPPDALEEFRVMTSAYSAENGRTSGGAIAVAVRSGTNQLHGGIYELFRNEHLNGNNFFSNLKGVRRPMDRYNQFGGVMSMVLIGFRVSIACRMAVESYRQGRIMRWDAAKEEIV